MSQYAPDNFAVMPSGGPAQLANPPKFAIALTVAPVRGERLVNFPTIMFALPDAPRETGDLAARLAQVSAVHGRQQNQQNWHPWDDNEGSDGGVERKRPM